MPRKRSRKISFRVEFNLPIGATIKDARAYLIDSIGTMHGCYRPPGSLHDDDPGSPFWGFEADSLRVYLQRRPS